MSVKLFMFSLAAIVAAAAIGISVALQFYAAGEVFITIGLVAAGAIVVALAARSASGSRSRRGRTGSSTGWWGGGWFGGDGGGWGGGDGGGGGGGCGGGGG